MLQLAEDLRVIDADSHMTERHDLFTERAPKGYEDKVPHVERGRRSGHVGHRGQDVRQGRIRRHHRPRREEAPVLGLPGRVMGYRRRAPGGLGPEGAPAPDGQPRHRRAGALPELHRHSAARTCASRSKDPTIPLLCIELYNDAMAEVQEESGNRLLPMPIMPAWDIAECVREAQRCAAMGYRGVNMTADPQDSGSPDLGRPGVGPVLGGLRRPEPARALPHRCEPDRQSPTSAPRSGRARTTT